MRTPAVAGQFYPADKEELSTLVASLLAGVEREHTAVAGIAPHAGLVYSGRTAAHTWNNLNLNKSIALVGPDHIGMSMGDTCVYYDGAWQTPLGDVEIERSIAATLSQEFREGKAAHSSEHSLEVQLPILHTLAPETKMIPIMMGDQSLGTAKKLAKALAQHDVTVAASSDYSHYVTPQKAREDDAYAIEALCAMDVDEFYSRIEERGITACGYGPQAVAAMFAKEKGAKKGVMLDYSTSPGAQVVGYASIVFV